MDCRVLEVTTITTITTVTILKNPTETKNNHLVGNDKINISLLMTISLSIISLSYIVRPFFARKMILKKIIVFLGANISNSIV